MQRDWEAGRLVGRYMVHRRIAAGGMATVHLGRLLGAAGFSRTVAIKRLHDDYARDSEFVSMLLDEARLASTIRHPNVVPTLDVVAEADELLVVMEYVEGDSLASLQRLALAAGERIPVALAASVVAQALHGLHAAHEARDRNGAPLDIVHRDVSPQNILVGTDGLARVLDFGIAKAASRASATGDGQLKGKTAYMAPEQLQHASVDRRTDVFAAATVLWELLAGRRLFLGDSPSETIARVLHDPIDSPQRWAPDVPTELALITLRGLEREPEARFATAEEMALAIEDAIALPRPKEIGVWVSRVAATSIFSRAEIVREVERESLPMQPASRTDPALRAALEEAERRRNVTELPTDIGRPSTGSGEVQAQHGMSVPPSAPLAFPPPLERPKTGGGSRPILPPSVQAQAQFGEELTDLATVQSSSIAVVPPRRRASRWPLIGAVLGGLTLASVAVAGVLVTRDRPPPPSAVDVPPGVVTTGEPTAAADELVAPPPTVSATAPASNETTPPAPPEAVASPSPSPSPSPSRSAPRSPFGKRRHQRGSSAAKADCRIPYTVDDKGMKHFKAECL